MDNGDILLWFVHCNTWKTHPLLGLLLPPWTAVRLATSKSSATESTGGLWCSAICKAVLPKPSVAVICRFAWDSISRCTNSKQFKICSSTSHERLTTPQLRPSLQETTKEDDNVRRLFRKTFQNQGELTYHWCNKKCSSRIIVCCKSSGVTSLAMYSKPISGVGVIRMMIVGWLPCPFLCFMSQRD